MRIENSAFVIIFIKHIRINQDVTTLHLETDQTRL